MKHHDADRPIGKCKGCCLNLKTSCAAGLKPRRAWDGRKCKHCNDRALLEAIQQQPEPSGAHLAKLKRQAKAHQAATEPHHNGVLDPGKMAGKARGRRA